MAILRVRLSAPDNENPTFHVKLPTYHLLDVDYDLMQAVVEVPDETLPRAIKELPEASRKLKDRQLDVKQLRTRDRTMLEPHIRNLYKEGFSNWDASEVLLDEDGKQA